MGWRGGGGAKMYFTGQMSDDEEQKLFTSHGSFQMHYSFKVKQSAQISIL